MPRPAPAAKQETKAETPMEPQGLCSTCMHGTYCGFCHDGEARNVLHCNEFEVIEVPTRPVPVLPPRESIQYSPYKGLCMNCDNWQTCHRVRPAGGVWYCENYS